VNEFLRSTAPSELNLPPGWALSWPAAYYALMRGGYETGRPEAVTEHTVQIDAGCYRDCECEWCGSTGPHGVHPFRHGPSMRVLVRCTGCNHVCEV